MRRWTRTEPRLNPLIGVTTIALSAILVFLSLQFREMQMEHSVRQTALAPKPQNASTSFFVISFYIPDDRPTLIGGYLMFLMVTLPFLLQLHRGVIYGMCMFLIAASFYIIAWAACFC